MYRVGNRPLARSSSVIVLGRPLPPAVSGCLDPTRSGRSGAPDEWLEWGVNLAFETVTGIDIETCQALELRDIDERLRIDALGVSGRP